MPSRGFNNRERKRRVRRWVEQFPLGHLVDYRIGGSLRNFSHYNLRVTLVTYGTRENYGLDYLASVVEQEDDDVATDVVIV